MLRRVEAGGVQPDQAEVLVPEDRPGAGREVLEPRPDREHDVRLGGEAVGLVGAGDADRPDVAGMVEAQGRLAGDGLDDGQAVGFGEGGQLGLGQRVVGAAARHDERLACRPEDGDGGLELATVGPQPAQLVHLGVEQPLREVVGLGLDILRQADERRAAVGRIEHRLDRERQRPCKLLGPGDPVPVPADHAERVVDRHGRVVETLDLLQHGVGDPALEGVPREKQDREPIRVGDPGGRDHVQGARADRRGRDHQLAPPRRLRVRDSGQGHPLLVLRAVGRKGRAGACERLPEAERIAVAEDREGAGEERGLPAVEHGPLRHEPAHDRLGSGQAHGPQAGSRFKPSPARPGPPRARREPCPAHGADERPASSF